MWQYHDKKMKELKKLYTKVSKQTQNRLQEIFDSFNINYDNLYNIADTKTKKRINTYIEEWKDKGLLTGYFGMLANNIYKRTRVKNSEILELLIYSAYIEEQNKIQDEELNIIKDVASYYYTEGVNEVRKVQKHAPLTCIIPDAIFLAMLDMTSSKGWNYNTYIQTILKYNTDQIYRQALINIQQQNELEIDSDVFQNIIKKQQNQRLCINDDKISGDIDLITIGINNEAKIEGIAREDNDAKVVFLGDLDGSETLMCHSLHRQEFYINRENEFDRYYGETQKTLSIQRIKCKGLVLGLNLPPISHHFHWCRSMVQYMPSSLDKENISNNEVEESDIADEIKTKFKQIIYNGNVINFEGLPIKYKDNFKKGLLSAETNTKRILDGEYNKTDYILTNEPHSKFIPLTNVIKINTSSKTSTLAHELFHKIDKKYKISNSKQLTSSLEKDFKNISLNKNDIIKEITKMDKNAFTRNKKDNIIFSEEYRGLADIINGYSKGKIRLGYGHSKKYWEGTRNIEKETVAQFGRMYYENNNNVINVLENFLPFTKQYIDIQLRKVVKKYV